MTFTPSSSAARKPGSTPSAETVTVERIGLDGDGIARLADGSPVYLPFTLPGETIRATPQTRRGEGWAADAEILTASPDRAEPPCPHFGRCGGCALQHWADAPYAAWKQSRVPDGMPLARTPPGARRRIDLALRRAGRHILVGLHQRSAPEIVDMHACPVLDPRLFAVIAPLRATLSSLSALKRHGSAVLNLLDTGPDFLLRTDAPLSAPDRTRLTAFATAVGIPRIAWARGTAPPETAAQLSTPRLRLGPGEVSPPPGAFLQASPEGEAAIRAAVLAGLHARFTAKSTIVELYAGCGTLTFALAGRARVRAYEGDLAAVSALRQAGVPRITAEHRDLVRQPLQAADLKGAAAIVLDPPWAGAGLQLSLIAASGVPVVIYVSCNPAVLSRDAQALRAAGYHLASVQPIDQFLWSARVEIVFVFTRKSRHSRL